MRQDASGVAGADDAARRERERVATVRELGTEWLIWLEQVRGAKPSTLLDYATLLRDPGQPFKRGTGESKGRILAAFGDIPIDEVGTRDVTRFLRGLDAEGLKPRSRAKSASRAGLAR